MKKRVEFILNNSDISLEINPNISLLHLMRNDLGIKSAKIGCGEGECGSCTVIIGSFNDGNIEYKNVASCILPVGSISGKHIVTVEGLNQLELSPVQKALIDEGAIQCGFCIPGFVVSLTSFFLNGKEKTVENIIDSIDGNICRCTGYFPIKRAAENLFKKFSGSCGSLEELVKERIIPPYFLTIPSRIKDIKQSDIVNSPDAESGIVAGGTDLYVGNAGFSSLKNFLDLDEPESKINEDGDFILIDSKSSTEEIRDSSLIQKYIPGLKDYFTLISSEIIRNRATLGGNIANASPIGDLSIFFLAFDSYLLIESPAGERKIELKDFFIDYKKTDLRKNEVIKTLMFKKPGSSEFFNFEKVSRRKHLDIASCNSAIKLKIDDGSIVLCSLSAGGVAPVPLSLNKSAEKIIGKSVNTDTVSILLNEVDKNISPISDIRGSDIYKRELLKRLIISHFAVLFPEEFDPERLL